MKQRLSQNETLHHGHSPFASLNTSVCYARPSCGQSHGYEASTLQEARHPPANRFTLFLKDPATTEACSPLKTLPRSWGHSADCTDSRTSTGFDVSAPVASSKPHPRPATQQPAARQARRMRSPLDWPVKRETSPSQSRDVPLVYD